MSRFTLLASGRDWSFGVDGGGGGVMYVSGRKIPSILTLDDTSPRPQQLPKCGHRPITKKVEKKVFFFF